MAFNIGGGGGGIGGDDDDPVLADINVTPLVDVMLVLLIIFMIAAPMLHQGVEVALPRADATNLPMRVEDPLVVSIDREGNVYLQESQVATEDLVERVSDQLKARGDESVFLKGDREVPYGKVIEVLDILHRGGIVRVGMITERPPAEGRS
ncbi:MAG: biopolymer transport protein TolR [Acidobacteriota bacterium]|jgi:biopolymer transport protein TolR|nr:biopolymer transport protein TolR [Acidobacteriota bacterium]